MDILAQKLSTERKGLQRPSITRAALFSQTRGGWTESTQPLIACWVISAVASKPLLGNKRIGSIGISDKATLKEEKVPRHGGWFSV